MMFFANDGVILIITLFKDRKILSSFLLSLYLCDASLNALVN